MATPTIARASIFARAAEGEGIDEGAVRRVHVEREECLVEGNLRHEREPLSPHPRADADVPIEQKAPVVQLRAVAHKASDARAHDAGAIERAPFAQLETLREGIAEQVRSARGRSLRDDWAAQHERLVGMEKVGRSTPHSGRCAAEYDSGDGTKERD